MSQRKAVRIALSVIALVASSCVHAVDAEPSDLDDRLLAKMAKSRAKSSSKFADKKGDSSDPDGNASSGCGVNIGNTVNSKPGFAPKEVVVVVKGDVINSNNRCK